MKIKEITVSAGRTIPHPDESYSNLKFHVQLRAEVAEFEELEDVGEAIRDLQSKAELAVESHKTRLLSDLQSLRERQRLEEDRKRAERDKEDAERRLARAKEESRQWSEQSLEDIQ